MTHLIQTVSYGVLSLLFIVFLRGLTNVACAADEDNSGSLVKKVQLDGNTLLVKSSKPISDDYFPCSDCHEGETTNFKKRELVEEHNDLKLEHGKRWCLDCHYADDRDLLHLVDATTIKFEESWKLCGQCHGKKLDNWRLGIHGKRTGDWNGRKEYETCVACHNPHTPKFKALKPEPPPHRPEAFKHLTGRGAK